MSEFKGWGPGYATGAETSDGGAPGNVSHYPSRESEGYVTGGEDGGAAVPGSNVPPRPNHQGTLSDPLQSYVDANAAAYGGDSEDNQTGSADNPADETAEDAGFYGSR